jgi:pilus assembly protein CpaD
MKTKLLDVVFVFMGIAVLIGLCACDMHEPPYTSPNRMQVVEGDFFEKVPVSQASDAYLESIAVDYDRHGQGPVDVTVTYDPSSKTNTAMRAGNAASRIGNALHRNGVGNVNVSTMPVHAQGTVSDVLIAYNSYTAKGPKDCSDMAGINSRSIEASPDYKLGCSVDNAMVKQIARPKDLAGRTQEDQDTDGRRSTNIVEGYRTGAPNKPLEGETASD